MGSKVHVMNESRFIMRPARQKKAALRHSNTDRKALLKMLHKGKFLAMNGACSKTRPALEKEAESRQGHIDSIGLVGCQNDIQSDNFLLKILNEDTPKCTSSFLKTKNLNTSRTDCVQRK